jgi:hypothetical protein
MKTLVLFALALSMNAFARNDSRCVKIERIEIARKILSVGNCANSPLQTNGSDIYLYNARSSLSINVSLKTSVTITDTCSMTVLHSEIVDSTVVETERWSDYVRYGLSIFGRNPKNHSAAISCEGYRSSLAVNGIN